MEDHHVDRPGVEVRQRMKLTGTNRSFGLIALINQCPPRQLDRWPVRRPKDGKDQCSQADVVDPRIKSEGSAHRVRLSVLRRPGGYCEEPEPDPIPKSAVKLLRANDTSSQDVGK